jgi:hypothetical protein
MVRNYTQEKEMFSLKQSGVRAEDIAIKYGYKADKLRYILRRYANEHSVKMVHYRNFNREKEIVVLYSQGLSIIGIAKNFGCTKQNISIILRRYCKGVNKKNISVLKHHCIVCGEDEFEEIFRQAKKSERFWKYTPIIHVRYICGACKKKKFYRCKRSECNHIGIEDDFFPFSINESTRTGLCRPCNAKTSSEYRKNNKDSWKATVTKWNKKNPGYHHTYWKNRRRTAAKDKVCLYCRKPLDDLNFKHCLECRVRTRGYIAKNK